MENTWYVEEHYSCFLRCIFNFRTRIVMQQNCQSTYFPQKYIFCSNVSFKRVWQIHQYLLQVSSFISSQDRRYWSQRENCRRPYSFLFEINISDFISANPSWHMLAPIVSFFIETSWSHCIDCVALEEQAMLNMYFIFRFELTLLFASIS